MGERLDFSQETPLQRELEAMRKSINLHDRQLENVREEIDQIRAQALQIQTETLLFMKRIFESSGIRLEENTLQGLEQKIANLQEPIKQKVQVILKNEKEEDFSSENDFVFV